MQAVHPFSLAYWLVIGIFYKSQPGWHQLITFSFDMDFNSGDENCALCITVDVYIKIAIDHIG